MHALDQLLKAISIAAFLLYGLSCLFSDGMAAEFDRFGLSRFRRLTGGLEVLGALGLAAGFFLPWATLPAAGGLALLMVLGVMTRIRVGDPWLATLPAVALLLVNAFIFLRAVELARVP